MNINLCYVEGISRVDTPYFASGSEQETFFSERIRWSVETTFYPPHYTNVIRFDTQDDIALYGMSVNYLYFEYNGKIYYYFIDRIEYSSEYVIMLYITMDYIQTYMFNIRVQNGVIERKHINRWNGNVFNRSYIRENVSNGQFLPASKNYLYDASDLWVVVKVAELPDTVIKGGLYRKGFTSVNYLSKHIDIPYILLAYPLNYRSITSITIANGTYHFNNLLFETFLNDLSPYIIDKYIVRKCPYGNVNINNDVIEIDDAMTLIYTRHLVENNGYWFVDTDTYVPYTASSDSDIFCLLLAGKPVFVNNGYTIYTEFRPMDYWIDICSNFVKNTSISNYFSYFYVPAIIDDNYLRLECGCDSAIVTYPMIRVYSGDTLMHFQVFDCFDSGISVFNLGFGTVVGNMYSTLVSDVDIPRLDIVVDSEYEYYANNHNRWKTAGIAAAKNIAEFFISAATLAGGYAMSNKFIASDINAIVSNKRSYDARFTRNNPPLKKGAARELNSLLRNKEKNELSYTTGMLNSVPFDTPLLNQKIQDNNSIYVPDKPQQISDAGIRVCSDDMTLWYKLYWTEDYIQCANYYHRNGYLVNEYVDKINNIFGYVRNRLYFNILKMSDVSLHLYNVIEDDETISGIRERLLDGIRLWNYATTSFTFTITITLASGVYTEVLNLNTYGLKGNSATVTNVEAVSGATLQSWRQSGTILSLTFNESLLVRTVVVRFSANGITRYTEIGDMKYDNVELDYIN